MKFCRPQFENSVEKMIGIVIYLRQLLRKKNEKFRLTGSIGDVKHTGRPHASRLNVSFDAVHHSVGERSIKHTN